MNRRHFVSLGAALAAFPLVSSAQQRVLKIGFITIASIAEAYLTPFRTALRDRGYIEGKTVQVEVRTPARAPELAQAAAELVNAHVDVIVSVLTVATNAARKATTSIPIVFLGVGDPVGTGVVASMNRPGANVTGIGDSSAEANAKTLELLSEALPAAKRVQVITDPRDPYAKTFMDHLREVGKRRSLDVQPLAITTPDALDSAVADLSRQKPDVVIIQGSFPSRTAALLLERGIPSGGTPESFANAGSLLCFAIDVPDICRQGVDYVQRIARGAKPADLPVQVPKRHVVLNLKTARALGIAIPQALLVRADRLIE
ncbi:MAG TPA: ABC transporter substrate-binding protein [Burkholderiales bacterium]|nr:ABC transporter substrate-binding protein [Burkholderiales bacterium]